MKMKLHKQSTSNFHRLTQRNASTSVQKNDEISEPEWKINFQNFHDEWLRGNDFDVEGEARYSSSLWESRLSFQRKRLASGFRFDPFPLCITNLIRQPSRFSRRDSERKEKKKEKKKRVRGETNGLGCLFLLPLLNFFSFLRKIA